MFLRSTGSWIRFFFFVCIGISYIMVRKTHRKKRKINEEENLSNYSKNEEGLYPWEVDTDDSPEKIPTDAVRFVNNHRPKRGRW